MCNMLNIYQPGIRVGASLLDSAMSPTSVIAGGVAMTQLTPGSDNGVTISEALDLVHGVIGVLMHGSSESSVTATGFEEVSPRCQHAEYIT